MTNDTSATRDPEAVRAMFGRIADRYDLANHLLSGGIDFVWRRRASKIVADWGPGDVLDLAAGSGDLTLAIQRQLPEANVVAADFSPEMLRIAERKGVRKTVTADALSLPFESGSFDCVTVAFGLRNMSDWSLALREMGRVLRPSGHLLILEFSLPVGLLRSPYRFYLHHCLPVFAALVTGQKAAYDYLGGSIEKFPAGQEMLELIEKNGFIRATARTLSGGIATIYTAERQSGK